MPCWLKALSLTLALAGLGAFADFFAGMAGFFAGLGFAAVFSAGLRAPAATGLPAGLALALPLAAADFAVALGLVAIDQPFLPQCSVALRDPAFRHADPDVRRGSLIEPGMTRVPGGRSPWADCAR